jgi:predicted nucleic acid-binding protein
VILIADTSGLLAAFDTTHPKSDAAFSALENAGLVVVSPLVLAEIDHVGHRELGDDLAAGMIEDVTAEARAGDFAFAEVGPDLMSRAISVRKQYAGLRLDLADAVNVALAEEYETDVVLTLDERDFRAMLPLTEHKAFRILPSDL